MQGMPPDHAWRAYELLNDEVGSQVDRGWAHTQFFVLLNAGSIAAVLAYLGAAGHRTAAGALFLGGAALSVAGLFVLRENKRYYRTLNVRRIALERQLGLHQPIDAAQHPVLIASLSPTVDADKAARMIADPAAYLRGGLRRGSVSDWARYTLIALGAFDLTAAAAAFAGWI